MTTYDVGDLVRLTVEFQDASGADADPTTVTVAVKVGGVSNTWTDAVKDATGKYHKDVSITAPGAYTYRWIGTGTVQAASEGRFFVKAPGA
jgi:hypothetical protein